MFITYTPDESNVPQQWEFVASEVKSSEGERLEKQYAGAWDVFVKDVMLGQLRARRHLLWFLMSQDHPTLLYIDTPDFKTGEVTVEFDRAELQEMRDKIAAGRNPDEQVLAHIDLELETAPEAGARGKARLNRRERRTGSRSAKSSGSAQKTRKT